MRPPSAGLWFIRIFGDTAAPIIIFNACRQLRLPMGELLDATPSPRVEEQVRSAASSVPDVLGLEKCYVRKVGFRYYVDLQVVVRGDSTVRRGHQIAHKVEDSVLRSAPRVAEVLVHIEPEEELLHIPAISDIDIQSHT
jgi:divalent metal cation (Fe/Co/Zn/Cd) transporter